MSNIILIRHGETDWNRAETFRGRADVELNSTGIKQAELLARYLEGVPIEAVYSSPLRRALKTAEVIAAPHNLVVITAPELIDFDYGQWQGMSHDAVKQKYKRLYQKWLKNPHLVTMPGGESLAEVRKRAMRLIRQLMARHYESVVLVSHRVVLKVMILALLGLDNSHFWNIKLDNCAITTFSYEDKRFVLTRHNDTSFLSPLKREALSDF